jgi:hypothetical protein
MTREGEEPNPDVVETDVAHTPEELQEEIAMMLRDAVFDRERNGVPDTVVVTDAEGHTYAHPLKPEESEALEQAAWSANDGGLTAAGIARKLMEELLARGFNLKAPNLELFVSLRRTSP